MKQYEFSSRNVQEAISKGLKELKLNQEDVDIKVLSEGGLFTRARILIITEEEETVEPVKQVEVKQEEKVIPQKPETKKEPKTAKVEVKEESKKEEPKVEVKAEVKEETPFTALDSNLEQKESIKFMKELAEKLGASVQMTAKQDAENIFIEMDGEHAGALIGYRGEGLAGIQYLANVIELTKEDVKNRRRIILNIENYKQKREESLTNLAHRMADKAIKTGRSQRLEPMNAYDRRIIHSALTNSDVTTYSQGQEPHRYLVIEAKK